MVVDLCCSCKRSLDEPSELAEGERELKFLIEAAKKDMRSSASLYAKASSWELLDARERRLERERKGAADLGAVSGAAKRDFPPAPLRWRPGCAVRRPLGLGTGVASSSSEEARAKAKIVGVIPQGLRKLKAPALGGCQVSLSVVLKILQHRQT